MKKLKKITFLVVLAAGLAGCGLFHKKDAPLPDERAGANLVIYFAQKSDTRHAARAIAKTTGGELFDIGGKKALPDLLAYDTFFVGTFLSGGSLPAPFTEFLAKTDFVDGRVIPFWTEPTASLPENVNAEFGKHLQGARTLFGGGFLTGKGIKAKEIEAAAADWALEKLAELGLRKEAGGDYAEDIVKLFAAAYRERISEPVFQDGDWTLKMDGVRWYYARGRFLQKEDAARPEDFRPPFLYRYSPEPDGKNPWQEAASQILSRRQHSGSYSAVRVASNPDAKRSPFVETLWQAGSRTEAFSNQQWIKFLGWPMQVHKDIVAPLERVEARIEEMAKVSPEIRGWMKNLESITGWNWRNVAGSESRSFHAFGVAVDLLLKAQAGMETYWQWTAAKGIDWHTVPAEKRQNPPAPVIRAFEEAGFIWGGRWPRYDTMHFEYHPELLILGNS